MSYQASAALLMLLTMPFDAALAQNEDSSSSTPPSWELGIDTGGLDDGALEAKGARIGRIDIQIDNVFDSATPLAAPYRLANGLHVSTRTDTVRAQVLFDTGDAFDGRVLEETARLLRAQRYLGDATVQPIHYDEETNTVDVVVRVHDVWTMSPGFSFGRKGGTNSTRLKFEDTNFLGLGKQIVLSRSDDVDRNAYQLAYTDPNVFGSWWKLSAAYASLSDGSEEMLQLSRPFYSLDTRWGFDALASDTTSAVSRYALGEVVEQFEMQERNVQFSGGISEGLQNGWVRRYLSGFRYDARAFSPRAGYDGIAIPQDRTVSYPWVGIELIEDQYSRTRNLDQIGRTEDLYLGRSLRIELGYAAEAFGSTLNAMMLSTSARFGAEPGEDQYLLNTADFSTRLEDGSLRNAQFDLLSRYYLRHSPRRVFFAGVGVTLAENLDLEQQLLLGGDNGLRGYPLRYQAGTKRALLTLEERFYSDWQPFKLVNVGAAMFFDAGRTWGRDRFAGESLGWLKDVGVGLRLGSARSGLGNVLHIDLAFPLDGSHDIDGAQLLIETRRSF